MCSMMTSLMTQKPSKICFTPAATHQDSGISKDLELCHFKERKVWLEENLVRFSKIPDKHLTHLFPDQIKHFEQMFT